nr:hypothetical protein Iba_chr03aCG22140 [Ipomoea batatas]GMD58315.1 hypothetical protein Iba_scaffold48270CG0010 [Ipomoea batatas]
MGREPSPATAAYVACLLLLGEIVTGGELTPAAARNDGTEQPPNFSQVTVVAAPWILAAASSSPPSRRWTPLFYKDDLSSSGSTQQQRQVSNGEGRSSVSACGLGALYMDDDGLGRRRWWCWFSALRSA